MHPKRMLIVGVALALAVLIGTALASRGDARAANVHAASQAVCPGAANDSARCHAQVVVDEHGNPDATSAPVGYGPAQFRTAYALPSATAGSGMTIAIVDAYDDPKAE